MALTETRASQTLVSRSGRSEWTSSLCSVSTASSSVIASSGPRVCSSCRKLAPLGAMPRWGKSQQEALPSSLGTDTTWAQPVQPLHTGARLPGTHHAPGHHSPAPPNLSIYLRGRGEDTGWQRSRLS